jgi:hypothetical protein
VSRCAGSRCVPVADVLQSRSSLTPQPTAATKVFGNPAALLSNWFHSMPQSLAAVFQSIRSQFRKAAALGTFRRRRPQRQRETELLERRLLLVGDISGQIYNDLNRNNANNAGEPSLPGWTVFIDGNLDGIFNTGEVFTTMDADELRQQTAADGTYTPSAHLPTAQKQSVWSLRPTGPSPVLLQALPASDCSTEKTARA